MKTFITLFTLSFFGMFTSGCATMSSTEKGAVGGGAIGAIIGHNSKGRTAEGALIGAVVGTIAGYVLDSGHDTPKNHTQPNQYHTDSTGEVVVVERHVTVKEQVPVKNERRVTERKYYIHPDTGRKIYIN